MWKFALRLTTLHCTPSKKLITNMQNHHVHHLIGLLVCACLENAKSSLGVWGPRLYYIFSRECIIRHKVVREDWLCLPNIEKECLSRWKVKAMPKLHLLHSITELLHMISFWPALVNTMEISCISCTLSSGMLSKHAWWSVTCLPTCIHCMACLCFWQFPLESVAASF